MKSGHIPFVRSKCGWKKDEKDVAVARGKVIIKTPAIFIERTKSW
jgi:hypothetical protein